MKLGNLKLCGEYGTLHYWIILCFILPMPLQLSEKYKELKVNYVFQRTVSTCSS